MHELGHNLGLDHGGNDGRNYKPNYRSVIYYYLQVEGLAQTDAAGVVTTGIVD